MTTYTAATNSREVIFQTTTLTAAKVIARREFSGDYTGTRIKIFEHTDNRGPLVASIGYVGRKGWEDRFI